jgi:hypothetical protein
MTEHYFNDGTEPTILPHVLSSDRAAAVDREYHWRPMSSCPRSVKLLLLGRGGVAVVGVWAGDGQDFWIGWSPLPTRPAWMKLDGQEAA